MGGQEDACWRCGVTWTREPVAGTREPVAVALRVIEGGAVRVPKPEAAPVVSTAERLARLVAEARA